MQRHSTAACVLVIGVALSTHGCVKSKSVNVQDSIRRDSIERAKADSHATDTIPRIKPKAAKEISTKAPT